MKIKDAALYRLNSKPGKSSGSLTVQLSFEADMSVEYAQQLMTLLTNMAHYTDLTVHELESGDESEW